jgi:hypothetical protein
MTNQETNSRFARFFAVFMCLVIILILCFEAHEIRNWWSMQS